jgi:hypothetical protein
MKAGYDPNNSHPASALPVESPKPLTDYRDRCPDNPLMHFDITIAGWAPERGLDTPSILWRSTIIDLITASSNQHGPIRIW